MNARNWYSKARLHGSNTGRRRCRLGEDSFCRLGRAVNSKTVSTARFRPVYQTSHLAKCV